MKGCSMPLIFFLYSPGELLPCLVRQQELSSRHSVAGGYGGTKILEAIYD